MRRIIIIIMAITLALTIISYLAKDTGERLDKRHQEIQRQADELLK